MTTRREKLASDLVDLFMEHLPDEVDLRLRKWYKLNVYFTFGADGIIYMDEASVALLDEYEE